MALTKLLAYPAMRRHHGRGFSNAAGADPARQHRTSTLVGTRAFALKTKPAAESPRWAVVPGVGPGAPLRAALPLLRRCPIRRTAAKARKSPGFDDTSANEARGAA